MFSLSSVLFLRFTLYNSVYYDCYLLLAEVSPLQRNNYFIENASLILFWKQRLLYKDTKN